MSIDEVDELLIESEYIQREVELDVERIPRNPQEVVDVLFSGELNVHGFGTEVISAFVNDPLDWDEGERATGYVQNYREEVLERRIENAGRRYRINAGIEQPAPASAPHSLRPRIDGHAVAASMRARNPRLSEYESEMDRLNGRNGRICFTEEVIREVMSSLSMDRRSAARFIRTRYIDRVQFDYMASHIDEPEYRRLITEAADFFQSVITGRSVDPIPVIMNGVSTFIQSRGDSFVVARADGADFTREEELRVRAWIENEGHLMYEMTAPPSN
jgi:hypothetical protein